MAALNPAPHFDSIGGDGHEVARVLVGGRPEIAAVLDGLVISEEEDLMALLRVAFSVTAGTLYEEVQEDGGDAGLARDMDVLVSRLPLAAKAFSWLVKCRETPALRVGPEHEGYEAEVAEALHGPIGSFDLRES